MSEEQIFTPLTADETTVTEVESLCMNCEEQGITKILLVSIPFFREVVLMSFQCPHCDYQNNEIQSASTIQEQGCRYVINATSKFDLNREVVKSEFATVQIPELDLELTPQNQKGRMTTIEGVIARAIEGLGGDQEERRKIDPEGADAIDAYLKRLEACLELQTPFTFIIDDPSGNSFVQTLTPPLMDSAMSVTKYTRSADHDALLGLLSDDAAEMEKLEDTHETTTTAAVVDEPSLAESSEPKPFKKPTHGVTSFYNMDQSYMKYNISEEVDIIRTNCPSCRAPGDFKSYFTMIPFFKEVIIMAFLCDQCGFKSNEIKPGGAVSEKGRIVKLIVDNTKELERDVLKSATAMICIPEIDLELASGTLGGKMSTVEGIILNAKEQLLQASSFMMGDSVVPEDREKFITFFRNIDAVLNGTLPFTFVLRDPMGNSFIGSKVNPAEDPKLQVFEYERSFEENEELGLNDINA